MVIVCVIYIYTYNLNATLYKVIIYTDIMLSLDIKIQHQVFKGAAAAVQRW